MQTTGNRKPTARRTGGRTAGSALRVLRREAPTTVALLRTPEDFSALRDHRTFPFDDHPAYLRQVEKLLRSLAARGTHVAVGPFDPAEYDAYCEETGQDPDTPRARTHYAADLVAGGPTVP